MNARLRAVKIVIGADAATSLTETCDIKLNSPQWGRDLVISASGAGLRTVPGQAQVDPVTYECDLPVSASIGIQIQGRWNVTAITPHVSILGLFESAQ
jgi:hypothetical protein